MFESGGGAFEGSPADARQEPDTHGHRRRSHFPIGDRIKATRDHFECSAMAFSSSIS
jgi:hypothetical protein